MPYTESHASAIVSILVRLIGHSLHSPGGAGEIVQRTMVKHYNLINPSSETRASPERRCPCLLNNLVSSESSGACDSDTRARIFFRVLGKIHINREQHVRRTPTKITRIYTTYDQYSHRMKVE